MKWSRIALVAITLPLVACSDRSDTWSSLSVAPKGALQRLVASKDGGFVEAPSASRQRDLAEQLVPAAQGWLQDLNSVEARDGFASACAGALDTNAGGISFRFVPLSKFGPEVDAAAARTLKELLPRTPGAPAASAVNEGPYLMMMRAAGGRIDNLLGDCLTLLQKLTPEHASLVTALRPLAEARDKDAAARYANLRDASGAGDPSPPPAMPISIVWFGRDSQPFAIFASPTKSMRAPNVDPLEICGFDPDTTRERTATACDRLLLAAARRTHGGSGEVPKDVVKAWLLANFENPAANFGGGERPPLEVERTQSNGAGQ